jgi:hypothetical protein
MDNFTVKDVCVDNILEYPTALGERCKILKMHGLSTYIETEETLMDMLVESAKNETLFEVCKSSSHCSGFYHKFKMGTTPFFDKDPIHLFEFNDKYYAVEGKHRICMAKRCGVNKIQARVEQSTDDWFYPLPEIKNYGTHSFHFTSTSSKFNGFGAILMVIGKPNTSTKFERITLLNEYMDTKGKEIEVIRGVKYKVCVSKTTKWLFGKGTYKIDAEVTIEHYHPKAKIWLLKAQMDKFSQYRNQNLSEHETICRVGCWRRRNL